MKTSSCIRKGWWFGEKEAAIDASNVAIFNPKTNKADRVGFRFEDGKKYVSSNLTMKLSNKLE